MRLVSSFALHGQRLVMWSGCFQQCGTWLVLSGGGCHLCSSQMMCHLTSDPATAFKLAFVRQQLAQEKVNEMDDKDEGELE